MKNVVLAIVLLALWTAPPVESAPPTMPFSEVRTGMRGTARTVFSGTTIESFEVEILGKLPNIGPEQDLILARLSGGPLAETGVLAGMSGSPVTIDGKLVGAIAYSWGFSTEAIAGITPIEEMLAIAARDDPERNASAAWSPQWRAPLFDAVAMNAHWERTLLDFGDHARTSWTHPLTLAGFGPGGSRRVADRLARAGITTVQAGASGARPDPSPPLEPGSAIGLKLVRGDVEMAATGTVTWVDGDGVLAFGHPLFALGSVNLPLTGARVEALLPSLHSSSRLAVPLAEVGALRQDRASGVFGRIGAEPRMIPIRVQLENGVASKTYSFDVADDPTLAPVLFFLSMQGILDSAERIGGNPTMRVAEGSVIKLEGDRDVALDNVFSGPQAMDYATGIPAYILHLLMNNVWSSAPVVGINVILEHDAQPRTTRLVRVVADRYVVAPGEPVDLELIVTPYRGARRSLRTTIHVPDEHPPGPLKLLVAGAATVQRDDRADGPILPRDLDQLILLINQLRRNDRLYIVASQPDGGLFVEGARMPNLPPSAAAVLSRAGGRGNRARVSQRRLLEESIAVGEVIEGVARLELEVSPR